MMIRKAIALLILPYAMLSLAGCSVGSMKGTPFFKGERETVEGPAEDRVNLWPLLYYRKPDLSVLWPLGEYVKGDHALFWPLFAVKKLDREQQQYRFLADLVGMDFDERDYHVFPAFWGTGDDDKRYFLLFPLLWWMPGEFAGVLPAFWGEDWLTVFPLLWYEQDEHFVFFPFFMRFQDSDVVSAHVLWPLFNAKVLREGAGADNEHGWRFWPLYGHYREGNTHRHEVLWPLGQWYTDGRRHKSWFFPLFYRDRTPEYSRLAAFPFFYAATDGQDKVRWIGPWYSSQTPQSSVRAIWPFYYRYRSDTMKRLGIFPLFYNSRSDSRRHLNLGMLLWDYRTKPGSRSWWALLGLAGRSKDEVGIRHHLFPLWHYSRKGDEKDLSIGCLLWNSHTAPEERSWTCAWVTGYARDEDSRTRWFLPFWQKTSKSPRRWAEGEQAVIMEMERNRWCLFPLLWRSTATPIAETESRTSEDAPSRLLKSLPPPAESNWLLFPLCAYSSTQRTMPDAEPTGEATFSVLWRLFDYKHKATLREDAPEKRDDYTRWRVLWRLAHYESLNDDVALDVFPGVTYDSKPGRKKVVSFLWRVFRYEWDKDEGRRWHVLFIPF